MAYVRTRTRLQYSMFGVLFLVAVAYLVVGGGLRDMLSRNMGHLSMLRLQFAGDAVQQSELQRRAAARLTPSYAANDANAAYSRVQLALAPIRSCPALKESAQVEYRLDKDRQQELARWVEGNSVIPICLVRNDLDAASAYYNWAEKAVPGLSQSYVRLSSQMASGFVARSFERYDTGDATAAEADWSTAKAYLSSAPYDVFGDVVEKAASRRRKAQQHFLASELASNPTNAVVRIYLAQAYNATSQGQQALDAITPLLKTMQEDTRVWQQHGQALIALKRIPEAEESLQKAVRLAPLVLQALNRLGVLYQATGKTERAEALFRQALASPGGADAYWVWDHLGDVLLQQGKKPQAQQAYETAIAKAPGDLQDAIRKKLER